MSTHRLRNKGIFLVIIMHTRLAFAMEAQRKLISAETKARAAARTEIPRNPFTRAINRDELAHYIIAQQVDLNTKDEYDGKTALMKGSLYHSANDEADIATLLFLGADPNIQDKNGWTALMYAGHGIQGTGLSKHILGRADGVIQQLFAHGADPDIKNKEGKTFFDLIDKRLPKERYIKLAHAKDLAQKKFNYNQRDAARAYLTTKLFKWAATRYENEEISLKKLQILLDSGIDINVQDEDGKTALMHAVHEAHIDAVKALLQKTVNLDIQDKDGLTALMHTAENAAGISRSYYLNCRKKIATLLLQAGANPYLRSFSKNIIAQRMQKENYQIPNMLGIVLGPNNSYVTERSHYWSGKNFFDVVPDMLNNPKPGESGYDKAVVDELIKEVEYYEIIPSLISMPVESSAIPQTSSE